MKKLLIFLTLAALCAVAPQPANAQQQNHTWEVEFYSDGTQVFQVFYWAFHDLEAIPTAFRVTIYQVSRLDGEQIGDVLQFTQLTRSSTRARGPLWTEGYLPLPVCEHQQAVGVYSTEAYDVIGHIKTFPYRDTGTYKVVMTQDGRAEAWTMPFTWAPKDYNGKPLYGPIVWQIASPTGQPIQGAVVSVYLGNYTKQVISNASGLARIEDIECIGGAVSYKINAAGYAETSGQARSVSKSLPARVYNVTLSANSAGTVNTDPDVEAQIDQEDDRNWFVDTMRYLFVPPPGSFNGWSILLDKMQAWGPFGYLTSFKNAWDGASRQVGEPVGVFSFAFTGPPGLGNQPIFNFPFELDMRPACSSSATGCYVDVDGIVRSGSGVGSICGAVRTAIGWCIYALFFFGVVRRFWPQLSA